MASRQILNVVLGPFLFSLAACASVPPVAPLSTVPPTLVASKVVDQTLICTGSLDQQFHGLGKRPARPATVLVVIPQDPSLAKAALRHDDMTMSLNGKVQDELSNLSLICSRDRFSAGTCKAQQNQNRLDISFSVIGLGSTTLALDKKTGKMSYGSGGMDGGWNFDGVCKAR